MRRAPAKPPAQPVGMAESKPKRTSWQNPAYAQSAHRAVVDAQIPLPPRASSGRNPPCLILLNRRGA